jgi:hypothetical protein
MITQEKINIYNQFKGNYLIWSAIKRKPAIILEQEWIYLEDLLFFCYLANKGLNAPNFILALTEKLAKLCKDDATIASLQQLATSADFKRQFFKMK